MLYRILADLVVLTHFAFILFVLFGGLLALKWRPAPWLHLPAAAWGVTVEAFGWICPLTPLENRLRQAGGTAGYTGDFIDRYITALIYPEGLTREIQFVLAGVVIALNVIVYVYVYRRREPTGDAQSSTN